ncbi:DnaJ homolog subfamily C member 2-like protein [Tanacetum coccineum]
MTGKASILQITYSNELINGETINVSSNCLPVKATRFEPDGHCFHDVALKLVGCFMEEKVEDDDEINDSLPKDKEPDYMQSAFRNYLCSGCTVSLTLVLDESFVSMRPGLMQFFQNSAALLPFSVIIISSANTRKAKLPFHLLALEEAKMGGLGKLDKMLSRLHVAIIQSWYQREGYVKSMADLIQKELQSFGSPEEVMIFFSAHGVPETYVRDAGDLYRDQMEECIYLIMQEQSKRSRQ